jgi:hypothetical protein
VSRRWKRIAKVEGSRPVEGVLDTRERVVALRRALEEGTEDKYLKLDEARSRTAERANQKYLR